MAYFTPGTASYGILLLIFKVHLTPLANSVKSISLLYFVLIWKRGSFDNYSWYYYGVYLSMHRCQISNTSSLILDDATGLINFIL